MLISVFDTTICDNNLGNSIIMEAVYNILNKIFPQAFFIKLPYLDKIGPTSIEYIKQSDYVFFGGTNVLSSNMLEYKQWGLNLTNSLKIKNIILLGVGWWQYQSNPTFYTKVILKNILNKRVVHSVRDNYTKEKLERIGFKNVINTSCPSMWELTEQHCERIKTIKSKDALVTFTNYNRSDIDNKIADIVNKNYHNIYVWVQGPEDEKYAKDIIPNAYIIPPSIKSLDNFLKNNDDVDYMGTRLHAGIRALQFKKRTFIIGIDNRAIEIKNDFNLPVINKNDIGNLETIINSKFKTQIHIPINNIEEWKTQFIR